MRFNAPELTPGLIIFGVQIAASSASFVHWLPFFVQRYWPLTIVWSLASGQYNCLVWQEYFAIEKKLYPIVLRQKKRSNPGCQEKTCSFLSTISLIGDRLPGRIYCASLVLYFLLGWKIKRHCAKIGSVELRI
jgi:hypothetical protein